MKNPINLFFQLYGNLGIPIHSREFASAIIKNTDREVNITPLYPALRHTDISLLGNDIKSRIRRPATDGSSLVFWYPDIFQEILGIYGKNIGYYIFEYTDIPKKYIEEINKLDIIMTASDWGVGILKANKVTIPIAKVPGGIDTDRYNINHRGVWTGKDKFKFLHIGKCEKRKGTELLIEAFLRLYEGNKDVQLTLSIDNPHIPGFNAHAWLRTNFSKHNTDNIFIQGQVRDIRKLYASHHCAVYPTRGEGIGLPIVESIACGLPTIVTRNSGTSEFLNYNCAFALTSLEEKDIYDPLFFPNKGELGKWLEPQVDEIASYMDYIYKNYNTALNKATVGANNIARNFNWDISAKTFLDIA